MPSGLLRRQLTDSIIAGALSVVMVIFSLGAAINALAANSASPASPAVDKATIGGPTSLAVPLQEGDVVITGFSGVHLAVPTIAAGVDPLSETVIDPNGVSLKIFDLSTLGGPTVGQIVDAPVKFALPANAIGQVFGLAFDDGNGGPPNLYVAATSAYGLQIVGAPGADGVPVRLKQGALGAAFMAGQFGSLPGASPGSIYRVDGQSGAVTLFADTAFSGLPNTGAGIGGVAFDPQSHDLYASDLDTGLIHRFNVLAPGADLGQYDHGTAGRPAVGLAPVADDRAVANISSAAFVAADPSTWGFTQPERRVTALAVHDGRLYYGVADGPSVWSVGLNADGRFEGDPRLELQIQAAQPYPVASIVFDPQGDMIVAQRGAQNGPFDYGQFIASGGQVLRYTPAPAETNSGLWLPAPGEYPVGLPDGSRMGAGGAALADGYNPDGSRGTSCGGTLLATGDDLRDNAALAAQLPPGSANLAGIQITDANLLAPQNVPPVLSAFLAFDADQANALATGHVGAVAAVSCLGGRAMPIAAIPPVNPSISTAAAGPGAIAPGAAGPTTSNLGGGGVTAPPPGGGGTTVPPPSSLAIKKEALSASCAVGQPCNFEITVTNPGPGALAGPIVLSDQVTGDGQLALPKSLANVAATSPWKCTDGNPFSCIFPGNLPPGDAPPLDTSFTLQAGTTGTSVQNCATLPGLVPGCATVPLTAATTTTQPTRRRQIPARATHWRSQKIRSRPSALTSGEVVTSRYRLPTPIRWSSTGRSNSTTCSPRWVVSRSRPPSSRAIRTSPSSRPARLRQSLAAAPGHSHAPRRRRRPRTSPLTRPWSSRWS